MSRQQGSMVYAELARRQGDDIRLMASIETVGYYSSEPSSQNYPPLLNLFYPDRANFISIISNFARGRQCGGLRSISCKFGFSARDRGDLRVCPGSLLERPPVVLAPRLSRRDDHRYGILSISTLSRTQRHTRQAGLSRTSAGYVWFVCRLLRAGT